MMQSIVCVWVMERAAQPSQQQQKHHTIQTSSTLPSQIYVIYKVASHPFMCATWTTCTLAFVCVGLCVRVHNINSSSKPRTVTMKACFMHTFQYACSNNYDDTQHTSRYNICFVWILMRVSNVYLSLEAVGSNIRIKIYACPYDFVTYLVHTNIAKVHCINGAYLGTEHVHLILKNALKSPPHLHIINLAAVDDGVDKAIKPE